MKRVMFAILMLLLALSPAMAATTTPSETSGTSYLHVANGVEGDFFQFNGKGVYVPQTDRPAALKEGWIVLSGQEPVTIKGPYSTIVLQRESILTVGATVSSNPSYYLVAGSASFLMTPPFSGELEVSTPVGIYRLMGPGELFVTSDFAELVFSLGGEVKVMNTITRQITDIPPFTYLNLADPFLNAKEVSRQTYETLSINPDKSSARAIPSANVSDGLTFKAPEPIFPVVETAVAETPVEPATPKTVAPPAPVVPDPGTTVTVPLTREGKKELKANEIVVDKIPSEGLSLTVTIAADQEPDRTEPKDIPAPTAITTRQTLPNAFDVYVMHTNDAYGQVAGDGIGYARLATLLGWGRELSDRNLVLDAGNTTSGTPVADTFAGETVAVLLDMLGYDAIAPGPADYAFGIERLKEAAKAASEFSNLKVLAANILDTEGDALFEPYGIFDLEGYPVAVIGLSVPPEGIEGITYLNDAIVDNAQALVDEVSEQADFVILLGNIDASQEISSSDIARTIEGIDLIVDGESAMTPAGGRIVGKTMIVNAGARLSSVGIVQIHVNDNQVESMHATRIAVEDVDNPQESAIAAQYGISIVPEDPTVAAYIDSQNARLAAFAEKKEPVAPADDVVVEPIVAQVAEPVETAVVPIESTVAPPETVDDPLAIKQPLGIVGGPSAAPADSSDWGVSTTFTVSRDGLGGTDNPMVGISINPFFNHNAFAVGLQAFFLTEGSWFSPSTYTLWNVRDESGTAALASTAMRFLDYIRYGQAGDGLYILADDSTPIAFGKRLLVNRLGVASGPYEERLGLYGSAQLGSLGLEVYADDLYLSDWLAGNAQSGGGRISYALSPAISLGLSSVFVADRSGQMAAYPTFDFTWTIKNERRLRVESFVGMTTKLDLDNFSFDTVYDDTGSDLSDILPNFMFAGGIDIRTLQWDFRFAGAVQNNTNDPIVSFGSFNQTNYSGEQMLESNVGIYYILGAEAGYRGEKLGLSGSWYLPIAQDLSRIIPLQADSSVLGDTLSVEATYSGMHFEAAAGFRRVGFLTAFSNLFDFSGGFSGFLTNTKAMIKGETGLEKNAQPYIALRYRNGLFGIQADLAMAKTSPTSYVPRFNLGASVTVGKRALAQASDPSIAQSVFDGSPDEDQAFSVSGDISSAYTRAFVLGAADKDYLTIKPTISFTKGDSFSIGIGPKLALKLQDMTLYSHDESPFSFGSEYTSTLGKVFDSATDLLSLVDHVTIGTEGDRFSLAISDDQDITMGPMVRDISTRTDNTLQDVLALTAKFDTKRFDIDAFANNLTDLQLFGVRFGITPFKNYGGEFGLSALGNIDVRDTMNRVDLFPTIDVVLPLVDKESLSVEITGSFATMVGLDSDEYFEQLFYTSGGSFLSNFNNYLFHGGIGLEAGAFTLGVDASMQKGALSYGMFNPLFIRERSTSPGSLLTTLDSAWTGVGSAPRSFTITGSTSWTKDSFGLEGAYLLPLSASLAPDTDNDLLTIKGSLDLSWFDLSLAYTRRGFASAFSTFLSDSSDSIVTRAKNFLVDNDSAIHATIGVTQGPMTFNATVSTLAEFTPDAGSWNGQSIVATSPALTLGVDINLF